MICKWCGLDIDKIDINGPRNIFLGDVYCNNCYYLKTNQKEDTKMETAEYNGKRYRKLKSLAPCEVLKDIKTECEKQHFVEFVSYRGGCFFYKDLIDFNDFFGWIHRFPNALPWLIKKGYVEEVRDEREEHFNQWQLYNNRALPNIKMCWEWFDQNPVPRKEKP